MLEVKLYKVILAGLAEANRANPFISKSDAMRAINTARQALAVSYITVK